MITAGIDCGFKNTKAVILKDGKILGRGMIFTGFDQKKAVDSAFEFAMLQSGTRRGDIRKISGTGSGKNAVEIADIQIEDRYAISKAARFFFSSARSVADVGAEEGRAARIDENGNPIDFAVNEKCAAGSGTFIEAMARALELTVEEMGRICALSNKRISLNTECAVFAESEVVRLIHSKAAKPDISKAVHDAMALRIVSMIRRVGVYPDLVLFGGVANNPGFTDAVKRELKIDRLYIPEYPEFGAATGAAAVAAEG
ncbi:MAG: acyl-CoA dehydratase activase [Thermodesulfobacteriota bacterium]